MLAAEELTVANPSNFEKPGCFVLSGSYRVHGCLIACHSDKVQLNTFGIGFVSADMAQGDSCGISRIETDEQHLVGTEHLSIAYVGPLG